MPHAPTKPFTDDTFTMLPPPAAMIAGATTWMPVNAPIWLTSITWRYSSTDVLMIDFGGRLIPALFTSAFTRPNADGRGVERGAPLVLGAHVEVAVDRVVAELAGERGARGVVDVGDQHARAPLDQQPRLGRALTTGRAGDDRDAAVERVSRRSRGSSVGRQLRDQRLADPADARHHLVVTAGARTASGS